jgi:predicted alpha/beta hydrolase
MPVPYQRHDLRTDDGFALTLFRVPPPLVTAAGVAPLGIGADPRPAVLLLPGMGANRFTFSLREGEGLPVLLAGAGLDVWIGEFRGARSSRFLGRGSAPVTLADKLERDLPAMRQAIARATGGAPLALVGHSLGGLLALLHAGDPRHAADLGPIVTVCAPGAEPAPATGAMRRAAASALAAALGRTSALRVSPLARVRGPVPHLVSLRGHFRPGTLDAAERRVYFEHAVEDIPGAELADLLRWQTTGRLVTPAHASCLIEARLGAVAVPVLSLATTHDGVVPAALARQTYDRLRGDARDFRLIGRRHGASTDYAHADVLLARSARTDALEPIVRWMAGWMGLEAPPLVGRGPAEAAQKLAMI